MAKRDYYDVLGVSKTASSDQIRTAYRKLARKYHPDVNKAADASAKFKEATEAYEVISDADKRQKYDQFGQAGPGMPFGGQSGPGGGRTYTWKGRPDEGYGEPGGVDFADLFGRGGGGGFSGMSLDDILASLGAGRRGKRGRAGPQSEPQDMHHEVTLDFMQAVGGTTVGLRLQSPDGRGGETIDVKIPPGVSEGSKVRLRGKGSAGGDLYLITHIREHPYFRRDGADIYVDVPISMAEAALGAKVDVPTLDGTSTVTVPPGSSSGRNLRLRGKGVASSAGKGDQYVVLKIVVPQALSPKGVQLLKQFSEAEPFDPRAGVPWK
jgi:curved DNA-binding protein